MIFAGVDISLRRGQTVALLDGDTLRAEVCTVRAGDIPGEIAAVVRLVAERDASVVAVDSPLRPCLRLLTEDGHRKAYGVPERRGLNGRLYEHYRICDYELIRRGLPLYQVAAVEEQAAAWMQVGFALARALRAAGFREPVHPNDLDATLLEVFPDSAFVTLLGGRPARKSLPAGVEERRTALLAAGIVTGGSATHDDLDAIAAALTAMRWRAGAGCALGHPAEGMIVLPVRRQAVLERYRRRPTP